MSAADQRHWRDVCERFADALNRRLGHLPLSSGEREDLIQALELELPPVIWAESQSPGRR
jgi:hypothetical protein